MALSYIAKSTTSSTSNTNTVISLTVPTGATTNDLLLAVVNLGGTTMTPTVPGGWAAVPGLTLPLTVTGLRLYVYYKLYALEAGPYGFDSSSGVQMGAALYCYRGNATGTIFGAVGQNNDITSDTSAVGPTLVTTVANSWVLSIASMPSNSTTFTVLPTSYVDRGGIGGKRVQLGDLAYPTPGTSTGALTWTSSASSLSAQVGIELLPLVAATTSLPPPRAPWRIWTRR
jgi:hypothetical protein